MQQTCMKKLIEVTGTDKKLQRKKTSVNNKMTKTLPVLLFLFSSLSLVTFKTHTCQRSVEHYRVQIHWYSHN